MTDHEVRFGWEDGGYARCWHLDCACGNRLIEDETVESSSQPKLQTVVKCDDCGRTYEAKWVGMTFEEQ